MRHSWVLLIAVATLGLEVLGFPDGAPVDACVKPRPNTPYHGQAKPQSPETIPYQVVASDSNYHPGQKITGKPFYN